MIPPNPGAPPAAATKKRAKKSRAVPIAIGVGVVVVLAVVVAMIAIPKIVAAKIRDAADARAITITYDGVSFGFGRVSLSKVVIKPKSSDKISVSAPSVDADVSWFTPTMVHIPEATVTIDGPLTKVNAALDEIRKADEKSPPSARVPWEVTGGTVDWTKPLGDKSSVKFTIVKVASSADGDSLELKDGTITLPFMKLTPLDVKFSRSKSATSFDTRLTVDGEEKARVKASRDGDGDVVDVKFSGLKATEVKEEIPGLDLSKTKADGSAHYDRTPEGAPSSKGDISITKVALPPIKFGPLSLEIGTSLHFTWKASPKKGKKGVMKLDEGKLVVDVRGTPRTVTYEGTIDVGEDGDGPIEFDLTWSTETMQCADVVTSLGGGLAAGLVQGTISVSGTLKMNLADAAGAKIGSSLHQSCTLGTGIPGLP